MKNLQCNTLLTAKRSNMYRFYQNLYRPVLKCIDFNDYFTKG